MQQDMRRRAAGLVIGLLGGLLLIALLPYASGLLSAPVLAILWAPLHTRLSQRMSRPLAATIILVLTLLVIVLPGVWMISLLVGQAQNVVEALVSSPLLARLEDVRLGPIEIGPAILQLGQSLLAWIGSNAFSLLGTATRLVLSLLFAFVGLFYLLVRPGAAWAALEPYIPFSVERSRLLRTRFENVTWSTVVGTGLNAVVQGTLLGLAFAVLGVSNALFWGAVTAVLSILPLVGSGLIWAPAAMSLVLGGRVGAAIALVLWGALVIANIDNLLRPMVYRRFAHMHPMITLVGAVVGVEYFGLVGLVLGPLAIQYFFELLAMYRDEYGAAEQRAEGGAAAPTTPTPEPDATPP